MPVQFALMYLLDCRGSVMEEEWVLYHGSVWSRLTSQGWLTHRVESVGGEQ